MYLPDHFRIEDVSQMHALMRAKPFATLVSGGSAGLYASHLPTVLKNEGPYGVIECHLARPNPHCKDLAGGNETLMIFQGPQGYITPQLVFLQSPTRKGGADLEFCGCSRLRSPRSDEGQGLATPARD